MLKMASKFTHELKIPRDRIAVLIGKKGEVKASLESETKTQIQVDSNEGDVVISGEDGLGMFVAREIIKAIGRGFNPNVAFLLLKSDYSLEIISTEDFSKSKNDQLRLKGRLIGTEGKARRVIEVLTGACISVYGKTVSLIGDAGALEMARKAVEMLLSGSPHRNVYKWLEKQRKISRQRELEG